MTSKARLANETWKALFRAQATIARELAAGDVWGELAPHDYGVLDALSSAPDGLRITELGDDLLLTPSGMSRLIVRLEAGGLVERIDDPEDGRAFRIRLTQAGVETQRQVGVRHGHHVAQAMSRALGRDELWQLRELCRALIATARPIEPTRT